MEKIRLQKAIQLKEFYIYPRPVKRLKSRKNWKVQNELGIKTVKDSNVFDRKRCNGLKRNVTGEAKLNTFLWLFWQIKVEFCFFE